MLRRESVWRSAWVVEAAAVGWFTVQALRLLSGALYAHISSADIVLRMGDPGLSVSGVVLPQTAQAEAVIVAIALLTPLLAFLLAKRSFVFVLTVAVVAVGRVFMTIDAPMIEVLGAALTVAGGMLYLAALARQVPARFAVAITLGLVIDQLVRAAGQSMDPTWSEAFLPVQTGISIALFVVAILRQALAREPRMASYSGVSLGGGVAFGALLFLQLALFGLPNALARWSGWDYGNVAPWLIAATALPLVPDAREMARQILSLVDAQWRGWFWLLLVSLLIVIGNRFSGTASLAALVVAQFLIVLMFWWVVKPVSQGERDLTGVGLLLSLLILPLLAGADFFTYEYAYVRDFGGQLNWLSDVLRALRGLGLGVFVVSVAIGAVPLMNSNRRIPWQRGKPFETLVTVGLVFGGAALAALVVVLPERTVVSGADRLRVATYNIHGGYSLYFDYDLAGLADTIWESGADVVLLQEVDAGRLISYGVDQAEWLGRRLGMTVHYLPTNEFLQGLAVLSRVPVTTESGNLLTSRGQQTGVQRIQLRPDEGVLDVYNTWLGLLYARDDEVLSLQEQDQWQQLQELLARIALDHPGGVTGRVVLGGTFNNTPSSEIHQELINVGFSDPFDGLQPERAATLRRGDALFARFDYLMLRNVLPTGRAVLEGDASDHRLAVVELNLE